MSIHLQTTFGTACPLSKKKKKESNIPSSIRIHESHSFVVLKLTTTSLVEMCEAKGHGFREQHAELLYGDVDSRGVHCAHPQKETDQPRSSVKSMLKIE